MALSIVCAVLQALAVRPYRWPAGLGARLESDRDFRLAVRPPDIRREPGGPLSVVEVAPGGPADRASIRPGTSVLAVRTPAGGRGADLRIGESGERARIAAWRELYWIGSTGPVEWTIAGPSGEERTILLAREPVWRSRTPGWMPWHLGVLVQVVVFAGCALVPLFLGGYAPTAALSALALALASVASGGSLAGAEQLLPAGGVTLTVLTSVATPLALVAMALAILYLPAPSAPFDGSLLRLAAPLLAATPMLVPQLATSLYLAGVDAASPLAVWNATHPAVYYASLATTVLVAAVLLAEGIPRFRATPNAGERRRRRVVAWTVLPGMLAFAVTDGLPVAADAFGFGLPGYPLPLGMVLHGLILLPAFGLAYAGVAWGAGPPGTDRRAAALANDGAADRGEPSIAECPTCGRCEEPGAGTCPADGAKLERIPFVPRIVDDKYLMEQLLGRGGMGAVYRARDLRLGRLVAVKVVRADLLGDAQAHRRFLRESHIVASLQHPSIVTVYDFGILPEVAYLVMELVCGEDLRDLLQREGRLGVERTVRILAPICSAVETAHREGILHQDLKPENILLPADGGNPKVLDFGVAKVVEDARDGEATPAPAAALVADAGMIVGTPAYMAPEQFTGGPPDARTDVFSLGVIAYEMLTGQLPFGRGPLSDIMLAQARGIPAAAGRALPPGFERAIRTALDPDPDRRPPSPQAFAHLLSSVVGLT